jgi:hypothetical protein
VVTDSKFLSRAHAESPAHRRDTSPGTTTSQRAKIVWWSCAECRGCNAVRSKAAARLPGELSARPARALCLADDRGSAVVDATSCCTDQGPWRSAAPARRRARQGRRMIQAQRRQPAAVITPHPSSSAQADDPVLRSDAGGHALRSTRCSCVLDCLSRAMTVAELGTRSTNASPPRGRNR